MIKADTKDEVSKLLNLHVERKLGGERYIIDGKTVITEATNEPIIYNSWTMK